MTVKEVAPAHMVLSNEARYRIVARIARMDGPMQEGPRVRNADDLLRQLVDWSDAQGMYFACPALVRRLFWWQNTSWARIQGWLDELVARGDIRIEPLGLDIYSDAAKPILTIQRRNRFQRFSTRSRIPDEIRQAVYDRDGNQCRSCSSVEFLTLDHIHPWSRGGDDTLDNLQTLCRSCNSAKGARV